MSNDNSELHIALYKKYRPRVWSDLVGQEKVAASLRSMVKSNKIGTAILFAGPRGTGKTSASFILAKAINCINPPGNGDPCNECEVCVNIENGTQLGFNYISMANAGGVDEIRKIVQQARTHQPLKRQVWILDETHNLSKAAFDALLIPLEEKTMPALFIFGSTEIHRIPDTILSRFPSRRFTLVSMDKMSEHVDKIAELEGLKLTEEERECAVRMGRGSVRDTLTSLETVIETGVFSTPFGTQILESLSERSVPNTMRTIAQANTESVDFKEFSEQLFEDMRDLLLIANSVDRDLIGIPPIVDERSVIKGLGGQKGIMYYMNSIGEALNQMSSGCDPRISLEVALLKAVGAINKAASAQRS